MLALLMAEQRDVSPPTLTMRSRVFSAFFTDQQRKKNQSERIEREKGEREDEPYLVRREMQRQAWS